MAALGAMNLYHFTSLDRVASIEQRGLLPLGVLSLAGTAIDDRCIWLTTNPNPQAQAWQHLDLGRDKTAVRFTVEAPDASRWFDVARTRGATPSWVSTTIAFGSADWWLSLYPVTITDLHLRGTDEHSRPHR